jgi:hypothetical protein
LGEIHKEPGMLAHGPEKSETPRKARPPGSSMEMSNRRSVFRVNYGCCGVMTR